MKENAVIRMNLKAKPGSKLEEVILKVLHDIDSNRDRLKKSFSQKKEKQLKKIERRGL